ncbi:hypothetical protein P3L10_022606 [Capsicum annuum]
MRITRTISFLPRGHFMWFLAYGMQIIGPTRGGLEKINWKNAPFVASYNKFTIDACTWKNPYPACVSTTTQHWWDQYNAWHLSSKQKIDYAWVRRNFVVYNYCQDTLRNRYKPQECWLNPLD